MKTNEILQSDVQNAIKWEPLLNAAEIGVTVKDGIITLTGIVDSYAKKLEAESAAKRVEGVKVVVEKIEVNFGNNWHKNDNEVAEEIINAFKWNWEIPEDKIKVKVEGGYVVLEGELEWNYQKEAAKKAVSHLLGVIGVANNITIKSETEDKVEKDAIENALGRNWSINDEDIEVKVLDHKVTLNGTVDSWYERDEAERIAWNAPGVWSVDNELVIEYD
jgi:osmotically-inducible protein OsmY